MQTNSLQISRIVVPASLEAADAGPFLAMVRLANSVAAYDTGHHDLDETPQEVLGFWQDCSDWTHIGYIVECDGDVVGAVRIRLNNTADDPTVEFDPLVAPDRRGEGIEEELLAATERTAREHGRTIVQTWSLHRAGTPGARLTPTTGWGSIPAADGQCRFLLDSGFALEQVERHSAFDLTGSFDAVERMLEDALAAAGADYRLVTWTSPTPHRYLEGFAFAVSRMSTDAPQGGMVITEEHWDADRVRRRDARLRAQGLTVSVACVEHLPSGRIVAYNELSIADDRTGATQQWGTLVLREHRGRRLGTVVKCANLLRWRQIAPDSPRVSTFNAEENRHMLDINETIGFTPISYVGAWKKILA